MTNYFENCTTADELKKAYFRLSKLHHPDRGGDPETMKEINRQYSEACDALNQGKGDTAETTAEYMRAVDVAIRCAGVTVELCGRWLWVSGDTRPIKDSLKAVGFRWAAKKKQWYWHPSDEPRKPRRRSASMQEIRTKYGSRVLSADDAAPARV